MSTPTELELLQAWVRASDALRSRRLIGSGNRPVAGDYAECLVARRLKARKFEGRDRGTDLVYEANGTTMRVQVKGRRNPDGPGGRQATHFDISRLGSRRFDEFVGVRFNRDFTVDVAWKMPRETARRLASASGSSKRIRIALIESEAASDQEIEQLELDQTDGPPFWPEPTLPVGSMNTDRQPGACNDRS